jgi:hypothetical protein
MRGGPADDRTEINLRQDFLDSCDAAHSVASRRVIEVGGKLRGAAVSVFVLILIVVLEIALIADVALADRAARPHGSLDRPSDRRRSWRRVWASGAWRAS